MAAGLAYSRRNMARAAASSSASRRKYVQIQLPVIAAITLATVGENIPAALTSPPLAHRYRMIGPASILDSTPAVLSVPTPPRHPAAGAARRSTNRDSSAVPKSERTIRRERSFG